MKHSIRGYAKNAVKTVAKPGGITLQKLHSRNVGLLWHHLQWRWLTESGDPLPAEQILPAERKRSRPNIVRVLQADSTGIAASTEESLLDKLQSGPNQRIQELIKSSK